MIIASSRVALGFLALAALIHPAWATGKGGYGGYAPPAPKAHHAPAHSHRPVPPVAVSPPAQASGAGAGYGADASRAVAAPRRPVAVPVLPLLPITRGLPASVPRVTLHGEGDYPRSVGYDYAPQPASHVVPPRRIEPGSFAPIDPRAFIGETPSGRVFMGAPAGVYTYAPHHRPRQVTRSAPYAQPKFIVIGEASHKHMSKPVHLTYGVQPSKRFKPEPQVVWLRNEGAAVK
jgi:hypothetical protein